MSVDIIQLWQGIGSRVGFYTKETCESIPVGPGVYAWILPLWLYSSDLDKLIEIVAGLHSFDGAKPLEESAPQQAFPMRTTELDFPWESMNVSVRRQPRHRLTADLRKKWRKALSRNEDRALVERALMESSILLPPLYVGKADSLRARYDQHVAGVKDKHNFHSKFTRQCELVRVSLQVSDLLFVCISTSASADQEMEKRGLNYLVEQIIMRLSRPAYSER